MAFPAVFNLADLNGQNGFAINGINVGDNSGLSVNTAGDINADGIVDIIIGAWNSSPNGNQGAGQSYVIFGNRDGFISLFNLSSLNGTNGFAINGINAGDQSGIQVSSAGDVNADGIADIIIGADHASPNSNQGAGQSYVIFGNRDGFISPFNLSSLNGKNGFAINGIYPGDASGSSVSTAGDINADGVVDVIVGAFEASPNGNQGAGQSYVIFGNKDGFITPFNLSSLNGKNGFTINGLYPSETSGFSVSTAGDINADRIVDLIIGAPFEIIENSYTGYSYVIFGSNNTFASQFNLTTLNGRNGFAINGIYPDYCGASVSAAGDINVDGIDDIVIGAYFANNMAGQSYVVFGSKNGFASQFNLTSLNGKNGFAINGINPGDISGVSVSAAGDINADGIADVIIGAPSEIINKTGQSYVVFGGKNGFASQFNLTSLNGKNGFAINGINAGDQSGMSVSSAGDVNADGIDDIIIGAFGANNEAGQSYVIFGQNSSSFEDNLDI